MVAAAFTKRDTTAALQLGVVKINIGAALSRAWNQGSKEGLEAGENHYGVLTRAMTRVRGWHNIACAAPEASGRAK